MGSGPLCSGFCQCGCGRKTKVARRSRADRGWKRGQPLQYLAGHGRPKPRCTPVQPIAHRLLPLDLVVTAKISLVDYARLSRFTWALTSTGYAATQIGGELLYMHRLILAAPKGVQIDHIDGDRLNNRRENLRFATPRQNNMNGKIKSNNTSGYKGVWKAGKRWAAYISANGERISLGRWDTAELAALAYNRAATAFFGTFARLNEVPLG